MIARGEGQGLTTKGHEGTLRGKWNYSTSRLSNACKFYFSINLPKKKLLVERMNEDVIPFILSFLSLLSQAFGNKAVNGQRWPCPVGAYIYRKDGH